MRLTNCVIVAALFIAAAATGVNKARSEVLRYRGGGPWEYVSDGSLTGWGINPASPGIDVPMEGDEARVNWGFSTVTLDYEAPVFRRLLIGVDESGVVEVNDGGILTTTLDVNVGHNNSVDGIMDIYDGGVVNVGNNLFMGRVNDTTRGFLNIYAGGVMNVTGHLWLGGKGEAEVNISGTLNQFPNGNGDGILGLGTQDFNLPGGTAVVNVMDGGELNLFNIHAGGTQLSIQPGSKIDITGTGRVTLPGNFTAVLEGYRDANLLFGDGVAGNVSISVEAVGGGVPGDFNSDGAVDGVDFLEWQRNQTVGDLADWQANFGGGASLQTVVTLAPASLSSAAAVPEACSLSLIVLGACFVGPVARRFRAV